MTALANLDAELIEAADGARHDRAGRNCGWCEAPLAAPFVMAGIRTASVWTIGAATLATTIGQRSLGDPIFAGLQTQNWVLVLAGCIASAGLALVADALFGLVERGFANRRPALVIAGARAGAGRHRGRGGEPCRLARARRATRVVIGAKSFSEQYILARADRLACWKMRASPSNIAKGWDRRWCTMPWPAAPSTSPSITPARSGRTKLERTDNPGRDAMYEAIARWEERKHRRARAGSARVRERLWPAP